MENIKLYDLVISLGIVLFQIVISLRVNTLNKDHDSIIDLKARMKNIENIIKLRQTERDIWPE